MAAVYQSAPRQRSARAWLARYWLEVVIAGVLLLFSIVMVYPFVWLLLSSFKTAQDILAVPVRLWPQQWTLGAYDLVWTRTNLPRAYANSLGVSAAIVLTVLFTSSLGGFVFARLEFPGRQLLFYFILATTMVPFVTLLIPSYIVMQKIGLLNTYPVLWLPSAISSFGIFLCRQFIFSIPQDLYEAAKIDGAGDFTIYARIIVPLLKPVLSALAIFTFLGAFNAYLWPLIVLNDEKLYTLPLILVQVSKSFGATNYQGVMAASVLTCIPSLLVYLVFQRNFVRGIALSGTKA